MNFIYYKRNLYKNYIYNNSPILKARQCVLYCHRPPPPQSSNVLERSDKTFYSSKGSKALERSDRVFYPYILYCIICNISVFKINRPYIHFEYTLYSKLIHPIFILNIPQQNQLIAIQCNRGLCNKYIVLYIYILKFAISSCLSCAICTVRSSLVV